MLPIPRDQVLLPLHGILGLPSWRTACHSCGGGMVAFTPSGGDCPDCIEARIAAAAPRCKGHWLYRLFDRRGRLLYVGVTRNPRARLRSHLRRWSPLVQGALWERRRDGADLLAAEAEAIDREYPALNVVHHEGRL